MNTYPALAQYAHRLGLLTELADDWIQLDSPKGTDGPQGTYRNNAKGLAFLYSTLQKYEGVLRATDCEQQKK